MTSQGSVRERDLPRCGVVEVRQYTLNPGQREVLIELFDRELVETQEAAGLMVLGQFRDVDQPDRFVWLRGFTDMSRRASGLEGFYDGPVWERFRNAANATMIDSDDVLLLRPAKPDTWQTYYVPSRRPPIGAMGDGPGFVILKIYSCERPTNADTSPTLTAAALRMLRGAGWNVIGTFVTEPAPNNFPRLPIREDDAFVLMAVFEDLAAHERAEAALAGEGDWGGLLEPVSVSTDIPPVTVRLRPTARSLIRL